MASISFPVRVASAAACLAGLSGEVARERVSPRLL